MTKILPGAAWSSAVVCDANLISGRHPASSADLTDAVIEAATPAEGTHQ